MTFFLNNKKLYIYIYSKINEKNAYFWGFRVVLNNKVEDLNSHNSRNKKYSNGRRFHDCHSMHEW